MKRFLPWIRLVVAAGWIAANWLPSKTANGDLDFAKFGEIPVLVGGRVKPLDTVARNSLLIIHGKQELRLEGGRAQFNGSRTLSSTLRLQINIRFSWCKTPMCSACSVGNKATENILALLSFRLF